MKSMRLQVLGGIALGAVLGYGAASGKLNPFRNADAATPGKASATDKKGDRPGDKPGCCSEGANKAQLLALADPKVKAAAAKAGAGGKKPNIVFIMGDDVGWFNIGA